MSESIISLNPYPSILDVCDWWRATFALIILCTACAWSQVGAIGEHQLKRAKWPKLLYTRVHILPILQLFLCMLTPTQLSSYYWMVLLVSLRTYKTILTSQYGGIFYVVFCHPSMFSSSTVSNKSVQLETHCHWDITELWIHTRSCAPTAATRSPGGQLRPHGGHTKPRGPATPSGGHTKPRGPATPLRGPH